MALDTIETTKGIASPIARPTSSVWTQNGIPQDPQTEQHTPLQLFQLLVGIHTPPWLTQDALEAGISKDATSKPSPARASPTKPRPRGENVGLYQRTKDEERRARIAYLCTSYISNTLFLLQIMLAAAFTGLSAYKEASAVTLTILGAFNTVVAGCLAWQKGQGVPQRYRKAMDQYQALILEIEMAERSFVDINSHAVLDATKPDPRAEKVRLQHLFDTAKADQQANYPDLYVSTGATAAKDSKDLAKQLDDAKADATKQLDEAKAEAAKIQSDMMAKIEALVQRLEGRVGTAVEGAVDDMLKK